MAKKTKMLVRLVSTANTGVFYIKRKNPKKMGTVKLDLMKYDKKIRKHVLFVEKKMK
jgi:large subunit ribosomal protein L33